LDIYYFICSNGSNFQKIEISKIKIQKNEILGRRGIKESFGNILTLKQAVLRTNEGSKEGASSSVQMDERFHPSAIAKKPV
jgi:hypothetical protein